MGSGFIPYAFSVHSFINSVGADVGFASIVGLALLVLLYFAQARETSTLRDQAAESHQRIQQLEARVVHLTRALGNGAGASVAAQGAPAPSPGAPPMSTGGRPVSSPAAGRAASPPGNRTPALTPHPAAPAMVAGPALSAATRLITVPESTPAPVAAPLEAPVPAGVGAAPRVERPLATVGGPAPATAAGNGTARASLPEFPGEDTFYGSPPTEPPPPRAQARPRPAQPPRRPGSPPPRAGSGGSRSAKRAIIAVTATLLVAAIAVIAIVLTSSGGDKQASHTNAAGTQADGTGRGSKAVAFNPTSVRLSVLNGTSTVGLAATIGNKLRADGYKLVSTGNASDQTHTVSTVFYDAGTKNAALQVAKSLKLRPDMVEPIDPGTRSLACQATTRTCNVKVVVTVGADLATTP